MAWKDSSDHQERLGDLEREIARRQKRGEAFEPVEAPKGNKLAVKFWGLAWQRHLEGYADYESRLPRGRSYLRQGKVFDLAVLPGEVTAVVAGSLLYDVVIKISPLGVSKWQAIKERCAGQVSTLLDLLSGKLGDGVLKVITDPDEGLFPGPREIKILCTCPDSAGLCKHAAAVLYAVGLKFDVEPALFFDLRSVNPESLLTLATDLVRNERPDGEDKVIAAGDIASLFGIEMDDLSYSQDP